MPLLNTGCIDYCAHDHELPADAVSALESVDKRLLTDARETCSHIILSWYERRAMLRPELAAVSPIIGKLGRLATSTRREEFAAYFAELAAATDPAGSFVYDEVAAKFRLVDNPDWLENIRNERQDISAIRSFLQQWDARLADAYRSIQGGQRDHDLGWVLEALADLYESIGGRVSYSTLVDSDGNERIDSPFVRFCQAFINLLPDIPGVERPNIPRLIETHFKKLHVVRVRRLHKNCSP